MTSVDPLSKVAVTSAPIHPLLADRWSPRGLDRDYVLRDEELQSLLEAARWSSSSGNSQPWRILPTHRGSSGFDALLATLDEGNQIWARNASALILMAAQTRNDDGKELRWAWYDAGQAATSIAVQATSMGLVVHPMGGFNASRVRDSFTLPEVLDPVTVLAVGRFDADAELPDYLVERERAPRTRLSIDEIVLS